MVLTTNSTTGEQCPAPTILVQPSLLEADLIDSTPSSSTNTTQDSFQDGLVANASAHKASTNLEEINTGAPSWWLAQLGYVLCVAFHAELGWFVFL